MDKNEPVVQAFGMYVETVTKRLNAKNLAPVTNGNSEPFYALLGFRNNRRRMVAGPYTSMRALVKKLLETDILDQEITKSFKSLIICAAIRDENGDYHFSVDIAECDPHEENILEEFTIQAWPNLHAFPDYIDIKPLVDFYRYNEVNGRYPLSMCEIDKFVEKPGHITENDPLTVPDMLKGISKDNIDIVAGKYILVGYDKKHDELVLSGLLDDIITVIYLPVCGPDYLTGILSNTIDEFRIKKLCLDGDCNIRADLLARASLKGMKSTAEITFALAESLVNNCYNGDWNAAAEKLGDLPLKPDRKDESDGNHDSYLYFIAAENLGKPSETLAMCGNARQLEDIMRKLDWAIQIIDNNYDSVVVGAIANGVKIMQFTVYNKYSDSNDDLAEAVITIAGVMAYSASGLVGSKYEIDFDAYADLVTATALALAAARYGAEEEKSDGE